MANVDITIHYEDIPKGHTIAILAVEGECNLSEFIALTEFLYRYAINIYGSSINDPDTEPLQHWVRSE